jgi:hypothetical protein
MQSTATAVLTQTSLQLHDHTVKTRSDKPSWLPMSVLRYEADALELLATLGQAQHSHVLLLLS